MPTIDAVARRRAEGAARICPRPRPRRVRAPSSRRLLHIVKGAAAYPTPVDGATRSRRALHRGRRPAHGGSSSKAIPPYNATPSNNATKSLLMESVMDKTKLLCVLAGVAAGRWLRKSAGASAEVGSRRGRRRDAAPRARRPDHRAAGPDGGVPGRRGAAAGERPHPGADVRRRAPTSRRARCSTRSIRRPTRPRTTRPKAALAMAEANLPPARSRAERLKRAGRDPRRRAAGLRRGRGRAASGRGGRRRRPARAVESARINLAYTPIKAPISGRTGKSTVTAGALVTAYQPTPLVASSSSTRSTSTSRSRAPTCSACARNLQSGQLDAGRRGRRAG